MSEPEDTYRSVWPRCSPEIEELNKDRTSDGQLPRARAENWTPLCHWCMRDIETGDQAVVDVVTREWLHPECVERRLFRAVDGEGRDPEPAQLTLNLRPALRLVTGGAPS